MTEQQFPAPSIAQLQARIESPEFRESMRAVGVTAAQAAERLRVAGRHIDLAAFEAQIAAVRPKLWKRMNQRPSGLARLCGRLVARFH